jgi:mannose-1-phosphate guanylyltransferase / mannose-6-phosphate isomerase
MAESKNSHLKVLPAVAKREVPLPASRSNADDTGPLELADQPEYTRPWGFYQSVDRGPRFQVKRIVVTPGSRLSLQKHYHRAEHWVVVRGTAYVTINDDKKCVYENESIYVPIGSCHRLENPGKINLELIEVQTGSYLGEDDIVRIEDDYSRS